MGMFDKIVNAQFSEGGKYIKPGVYRLKIQECKYKKSRTNKDLFFVIFNVLESSGPAADPVGQDTTWMVNLANEPAMGNIKQFVQIAAGEPNGEVNGADVEKIIGPDQPFTGIVIRATVTEIQTRAKTPFYRFKAYLDSDGAESVSKASAEEKAA